MALPDVVGDHRAQNQPGTDQEYPNWRIPLGDAAGRSVPLENLGESALLGPLVEVLDDAVVGRSDSAVD